MLKLLLLAFRGGGKRDKEPLKFLLLPVRGGGNSIEEEPFKFLLLPFRGNTFQSSSPASNENGSKLSLLVDLSFFANACRRDSGFRSCEEQDFCSNWELLSFDSCECEQLVIAWR